MSLNKSIQSGKSHRKPYRGAKAVDATCRNHGSCEWCHGNRRCKLKKLSYRLDGEKGYNMKNVNEILTNQNTRVINGEKCIYHHTATTAGYVSVKCEESEPIPYKGHFGEGYKIRIHNPESTQYCYVQYWIKEGCERK